MFTKSTIYDGTVTLGECIATIKAKRSKNDYISQYHKLVANIYGVKYVYSFGSGRGALYAILKCLNIGQGDDVLIQGYTCVAVPKAIIYAKATPIYADISIDDYSLTLESIKKVITPRTKAVIVQHTYGIPCKEIFDIYSFCKAHGIYLVEDCAHTFATRYQNQYLGTIGDVAFISTDHSKFISTSVGGLAITDNKEIGEALGAFYSQTNELTSKEISSILFQLMEGLFWSNKYINGMISINRYLKIAFNILRCITLKIFGSYYLDDYDNFMRPCYSFPAKLSNVQAFLGMRQIEKINQNITHRRTIVEIYKEELKSKISICQEDETLLLVPILTDQPDSIIRALKRITEASRWFSPEIECITEHEYDKILYDNSQCPSASYVSKRVVTLPTHHKITEKEAKKVCRILREIK